MIQKVTFDSGPELFISDSLPETLIPEKELALAKASSHKGRRISGLELGTWWTLFGVIFILIVLSIGVGVGVGVEATTRRNLTSSELSDTIPN